MLSTHFFLSFALFLLTTASIVQFGIYPVGFLFPATVILSIFIVITQKQVFHSGLSQLRELFYFYFILILYSCLASLIQNKVDPLVNYGFFSLCVFTCILSANPPMFKLEDFFNKLLIIFIIICILSLFFGLTPYRFSGVFYNPNGMGRFASISFGVLIIYLLNYKDKSLLIKYTLMISAFVLFIFTLFSNSRGALLSAIIPLFTLALIFYFNSFRKIRFFKRKTVYYATWSIILIPLTSYLLLKSGALSEVINKFHITAARGDITQDRATRWHDAIPYINYFGNGSDIYNRTNLTDVHNNYIGQALLFGSIGAFLFFIPFIYILFKSIFYLKRKQSLAAQVCFFSSSYFLIYSTIETGAAIFVVWICFIAYACMVKPIPVNPHHL